MGQRSQIIVKLPEHYVNENNRNNKPERYLLFHNQWLYGYGFIRHLADILENFEKIRKRWNEGEFKRSFPDYEEYIEDSIKCANYKDPTNIRRTHKYDDGDDTTYIKRLGNWDAVMESLDNNNGYMFLEIDKEGNIRYDIVNGLEDAGTRERRTPEEYLELFETPMEHKDVLGLLKEIGKFERFNYKDLNI